MINYWKLIQAKEYDVAEEKFKTDNDVYRCANKMLNVKLSFDYNLTEKLDQFFPDRLNTSVVDFFNDTWITLRKDMKKEEYTTDQIHEVWYKLRKLIIHSLIARNRSEKEHDSTNCISLFSRDEIDMIVEIIKYKNGKNVPIRPGREANQDLIGMEFSTEMWNDIQDALYHVFSFYCESYFTLYLIDHYWFKIVDALCKYGYKNRILDVHAHMRTKIFTPYLKEIKHEELPYPYNTISYSIDKKKKAINEIMYRYGYTEESFLKIYFKCSRDHNMNADESLAIIDVKKCMNMIYDCTDLKVIKNALEDLDYAVDYLKTLVGTNIQGQLETA